VTASKPTPPPACDVCEAYLVRRANVLMPEILTAARARRIKAAVMFRRFLAAVHHRHTSGLSIGNEVTP